MRLDDDDVSLVIERHALGPAALDLRHLPLQQIVAVRIEFLDAPGHVAHVNIVVPIDRHRAWLDEPARPIAPAADHAHLGENGAANSVAAWPVAAAGEQHAAAQRKRLAKSQAGCAAAIHLPAILADCATFARLAKRD